MIIHAAWYGVSQEVSFDARPMLDRMVVAGCLTIPKSLDLNLLLGDPAPGVAKLLSITYSEPGHPPRSIAARESFGCLESALSIGVAHRLPWRPSRARGRIACIYAYYEKTRDYLDNLAYFLRHGVDDEIDYVFVVNGSCSLRFPERPNIKVILRENSGFDFGGHSAGVASLDRDYDYYVFLNATCRGPFLPPYVRMHWSEPFLDLMNEKVHLCGASIAVQYNTDWIPYFTATHAWPRQYYPAVESYFFVLSRTGLDIALAAGIFSPRDERGYWDVVFRREIGLSISILSKGYNIDCLIPEMHGVDYRNCFANFNPSHFTPTGAGSCFGRSLHPYEVVFIKQNRSILDAEVNSLSRYFDRPPPRGR